jgi:hypothetical protein
VGEKAFYERTPGAMKGPVYVILSDGYVGFAQDAMVKQGLTSFANTLLAK